MEITNSGAGLLVNSLVELGVDTVFGIPGIHNLSIYGALLNAPIRHVTARNEAGAGFMADGYARSTGRPGVALVITGPGLTNAMTAIGEAYRDAVPLLVLSSQIPRTHLGRNTGYLHELKNSNLVLSAVTKESRRVMEARAIPETLRQAYALTKAGRPGPVHVEMPLDVLDELAPSEDAVASSSQLADIELAAGIIREGSRPLVLVGGGGADAADEILRLARSLDAPVVSTAAGKGVVDERDPLCLGGRLHAPVVREMISAADPLIVIGSELSPTDIWFDKLPVTGPVVSINAEPMDFHRTLDPDVSITGRAETVVPILSEALRGAVGSETGQDAGGVAPGAVREAIVRATKELPEVLGQPAGRFERMRNLLLAVREALPESGVLSIDMTTMAYVALSEYPAYGPRSFLHPVGFGTLGYALPSGIGAKIAEPDRPVVVVTGDGGFQFTQQELGVAAQEGIPLPIIVWDDDGYGEIRRTEDERHPGRRIAVDNRNPDFPALAQAYGIPAHRVTTPDELSRRVTAALHSAGPEIIHLPAEAD